MVFTASEVETASLAAGINPAFAGLLGGMTGGVAQAYATMGGYPIYVSVHFIMSSQWCTFLNRLHDLYENC